MKKKLTKRKKEKKSRLGESRKHSRNYTSRTCPTHSHRKELITLEPVASQSPTSTLGGAGQTPSRILHRGYFVSTGAINIGHSGPRGVKL